MHSAKGDIWHACTISSYGTILGWQHYCHVCCLVELWHVRSTKPSLNWPDEPQCLALSVKLLLLLINHTSCCRCRYIFIRSTRLYFRPYALVTVYQIIWVNVILRGQRGACNMHPICNMDMSVWRKQRIKSFKSYKPFKSIMILISHCYISKHLQVKWLKRKVVMHRRNHKD